MWVWEANNPRGVLVIVHGANEHHGRYKWLIEQWYAEGFNVVIGDLPGQGETTKKERGHIDSFDEYITVIEEWIKKAESYQVPIFILGHSMGGLAVIRTLQEKELPITGVLLSSPCLGLVNPPSIFLDILTKGINIFIPRLRINSGVSVDNATRSEMVRDEGLRDPLYNKYVSIRWYRELAGAMIQASKEVNKFPNLPLLVLQGGDDKIVDKTAVKQWFNHVTSNEKTYKEYPHLYHEVFNEPEKEEVFTYALSFVKALL
ncbi:alpha/beta hydrolase [Litchfieldia alkalitelluris]|uniref:alpha/beta hydrolase n=1 Tax=Litchfieldia alkalitelluris TaxID=304268 RepID=UPI000997326F|nr:alpha/beta hydrolase [Litchfieldia alkalitelluris]